MVAQTAGPGAAFKSLSPNDAIQFILADIPTFTVGILSFGTFTFFFLMKRVDRWIFCLHMSVLLAFLAAILDISQILIQGRASTDVTSLSAMVSGLVTAREVFYAFSGTLRFLFYWGFVAMIPLGETIPDGNKMHSGSWRRWGIIGAVLKWSTSLLIFIIAILQVIYRVVPGFQQIGMVYESEATIEIILSAIFVLKLLLNTWARFPVGTTTPSKGKMLVQYLPMIVALLFSLWIATGNVIIFNFTETVLGRFMRAVEIYVVIVYMLTVSFYHLRHLSFFPVYRPVSRSNTLRRRSIEKEKSGELYPTDVAPEPTKVDLVEVLEEQYRSAQEVPQTRERQSARSAKVESANQHQSIAVRFSTWLGIGRPLPQPPQPQRPPSWDVDAERGPSPALETPTQWQANEKAETPTRLSPVLDEDEKRGVSPVPGYTPRAAQIEERDIISPVTSLKQQYAFPRGKVAELEPEETPVPGRDWQDIEFSNAVRHSGVSENLLANALQQKYYEPQDEPQDELLEESRSESPFSTNIQVVSPSSDDGGSRTNTMDAGQYYPASPLASAVGTPYPMSPLVSAAVTPLARSRPLPPMPVLRPTSTPYSPTSPIPPDSARSSNMSILLRRQTELDESIAALRLFSPSKQAFDLSAMPIDPAMFYNQYEPTTQPNSGLSPVPSSSSPEYAIVSPELTLATPRADAIPESSAQSEFYFDNQPPLNRSSRDSGVMPAPMLVREELTGVSRAPLPVNLAPPPFSRFSNSSSVGDRRKGVDSNGTQYDITSFVGNLTVPVDPEDSLRSASPARSSVLGSVHVATVANAPHFMRPTLITQSSREEELAPANLPVPSTTPTAISPARRALPPIPQLVSQAQAHSPPGRVRRGPGLPPHPRLSARNLTPVEESVSSPSDTATLVTSPRSAGTPKTVDAW